MKLDSHELIAALAPGLLLAVVLGAAAAVPAITLDAAERASLWQLIEPRVALVLMLWFFASLAAGLGLRAAWLHFGAASARLAEQVQIQVTRSGTDPTQALVAAGSKSMQALAATVNVLVRQRDQLRSEIAVRVAEGSREVEQERSRLAALMSELTQSVVVCNLDGRILLFNARARVEFRALNEGSAVGGTEPIALGRSIYGVLDQRLVAHALEAVQQRLSKGASAPSAQFVTATRSGQLLRVQMAPVRETAASNDQALNGFVLMLDNITRAMEDESARERLLHRLTEGSRGSLGNLQAAVEILDDAALDGATRERFFGVIRDEIGVMARRLNETAADGSAALNTRWPLEDMLGADLMAAAIRRIESELPCTVSASEVDPALWLRVESFSVIEVLLHLTRRLVEEFKLERVELRLRAVDQRAQLDLVWAGRAMSSETFASWETEPLTSDGGARALTLRDVVQRHGGAFWFERARLRQEALFRFLLPLAGESAPLAAAALMRHDSRPEFYDFDLFDRASVTADAARALADCRLVDLTYTVFDTETTGLEPAAGDEIIQIGATRIVAAKLRRQDCFEQLIDPQRSLPATSVAIHGIEAGMVAGQPRIAEVLPAFHAFAQDSVLVAHNAAFDLRFLQLKEESTGVRFEQPVLDTLLLSAVIHPQQESHRLEAIAERLAVPVLGRHSALGDAIVTAEVFLKMLPLLEAMGITTLGQALAASRKTALARLRY